MKFKFISTIIITLSIISSTFSWGEEGHKLVNSFAVDLLPEEMNGFKLWKDYIIEHAADPDKRRNNDSTEYPKHFIDIDYYEEFLNGSMIINRKDLTDKYGDSIITKIGTIPWATVETFENLRRAFKEKNRDKVLIYASDLGHYVADAHQPMHTILNYDGQLSGQKGIHERYETKMLDDYFNEVEKMLEKKNIIYVENPLNFIFEYITATNTYAEVLFVADRFAYERTGSIESEEYYRLLWFRTKYLTTMQLSEASKNYASLIYTAWIDAGKPEFESIK